MEVLYLQVIKAKDFQKNCRETPPAGGGMKRFFPAYFRGTVVLPTP
jgi:hypothetical protein